jgi:hypothetical protein
MSRTLVVLLLVLVFAVLLALVWLGWRGRARRQSDLPPLPPVPQTLGPELLPPLTGLYVGTTVSAQWQNRIVVHTLGERADAVLHLSADGVVIRRQGAPGIHIPAAALIDARLEPALAGKVVGRGGLLVLRWQHGDVLLDTGLRADDKAGYPDWVQTIGTVASNQTSRGTTAEDSTEEAGNTN